MCKVMIFSNGRKLKGNVKKAVNFAKDIITRRDDDGFGWMSVDTNGKLFGERSTMPDMFHTMFGYKFYNNQLSKLPNAHVTYNSFGDLINAEIDGAIMFHGRTSTNDKTLINTHPIMKDGWAVIHNGVVTNQGKKYKKKTTNDTEDIVHYLSKGGLEAVADNLSGYYAVGAFDPKGHLHVFKDDIASLCVSYIPKLESYVFATTDDLIADFCAEMKINFEPITPMMDNTYLVLDKDNNILDYREFTPMGMSSYYEKSMMGTSLHYKNGYSSNSSSSINDSSVGANERESFDHDGYYNAMYPYDSRNYKPSDNNAESNIVDVSSTAEKKTRREEILDSIVDDPNEQTIYLEDIMEYASAGYIILDKNDNDISYEQFKLLETNDKLQCLLLDPITMEPVVPYTYESRV